MTDNIEIKWKWLNEEKKYKVYEDGRIYSDIPLYPIGYKAIGYKGIKI